MILKGVYSWNFGTSVAFTETESWGKTIIVKLILMISVLHWSIKCYAEMITYVYINMISCHGLKFEMKMTHECIWIDANIKLPLRKEVFNLLIEQRC